MKWNVERGSMERLYIMKKLLGILVLGLLYGTSISSVQSFENNKKEIGFYFGTKIYEERHHEKYIKWKK